MRTKNLISVLHGHKMLYLIGKEESEKYCFLKKHEVETLDSFYQVMEKAGGDIADFDGYYVGYTIKQIGKEFDLLRFGKNSILNIELKQEHTGEKMLLQMRKNYYYLKLLGKPISIFTYVKGGGCYKYNEIDDEIQETTPMKIVECIKAQSLDHMLDPDKEFSPSHYLVSPFNSTQRFLNNEYFLTDAQQNIKEAIDDIRNKGRGEMFCLSANAGTGKTLLIYDYAKDCYSRGEQATIIHCGKLNEGQEKLIDDANWKILSVKEVNEKRIEEIVEKADLIVVDEAQRIWDKQLELIIKSAVETRTVVVFSYDIKQFFHETERKDIYEILVRDYPNIKAEKRTLTNKIRTNKELASFIKNLFDIGSSNSYMDYSQVSIDYIGNYRVLQEYTKYLTQNKWTPITYTISKYKKDTNSELFGLGKKNAHDVIGQEYEKVAVVMNKSFNYDNQGRLDAEDNYYSSYGMLYQIVTRVVDELKIIVYKNPELYLKLLEIKEMGKTEEKGNN